MTLDKNKARRKERLLKRYKALMKEAIAFSRINREMSAQKSQNAYRILDDIENLHG
ncbi:Lacal_2735 family protein [Spongiivirga sp. MCCC 1A20706]|uniref:Lacal_2735 family protein n=1 Tax=Spongiivirga sp. MCCC 1A20706 TaxID=3160963 RepID=UPI003977A81B